MIRHPLRTLLAIAALALLPALAVATPASAGGDLHNSLLAIAHRWAQINYQMPKAKRDEAFAALATRAATLAAAHPGRAEPKVWQAIVLSTEAGVHGGFGALSMVRHARKLLLAAEKIDPNAMHGSIYTSLGSLYYQVPGWPLGFGDNDTARTLLKKALAINPTGIDPNYFYGDFLFRRGHPQQALTYLHKALQAPPRPDRPLADQGRRRDVRALIARIQSKH